MADLSFEKLGHALIALIMLIVGIGMAAFEWSRTKTKRPLFKGRQVVVLYWVIYLSSLVLGVTFAIAAIMR